MNLGTKVLAKREGKYEKGFVVAKAHYNNKDMVAVKFSDDWEIWYPEADSTKEHGSIKEDYQNEPMR